MPEIMNNCVSNCNDHIILEISQVVIVLAIFLFVIGNCNNYVLNVITYCYLVLQIHIFLVQMLRSSWVKI